MSKRMDVGTSWHTVAKHNLMRSIACKQIVAANKIEWLERIALYDLTAGNGIPAYDAEWSHACSPGILASQATKSGKPVLVDLYEKDAGTYGKLLASLTEQLPFLGYRQTAENRWQARTNIVLRATHMDGRMAPVDHLRHRDDVLVFNDPNSITEWAMRSGFAQEISRRAKGLRILSTLGCNVCGIKMLPYAKEDQTLPLGDGPEVMSLTERRNWFRLVTEQQEALLDRHDLLLAAFERDSSQWAYLLSTPATQRWTAEAEKHVHEAFSMVGRTAEMSWFRQNPDRFDWTKRKLFLTKSELQAQANTPLPLDGLGDGTGAA
jgi:hypothetical protein